MRRFRVATGVRRAACAAFACLIVLSVSSFATNAQDVGPAGIVSNGETVLLRESPGFDAMALGDVPDGSAIEVTGAPMTATDGTSWLPVVIGGQSGYVPSGYVASSGTRDPAAEPDPAAVAEPIDHPVEMAPAAPETTANSAETPAAIPAAAPEGAVPETAPVAAPEGAVAETAPVAAPAPVDAPVSGAASTTTESWLVAWPGADATVLQVLPAGSALSVDGPAENGFVPVTGNGISGWIDANLLTSSGTDPALPAPAVAPATSAMLDPAAANVAPAPDPVATTPASDPGQASIAPPPDTSTSQGTGIVWPFSGREWEVVQGYNNGTHTNRSSFAQYKYSLDWAVSNGDSAGQPIYAPISGTIRWTDRGSGGILMDAGNGYGVALFHITVDRSVVRNGSVERGQQIGVISGPGDEGYMSMAHIEIAAWRFLNDGGHESVPFTGPNAIAGQEFPDNGGGNQYMGATINP